MFPVGEFGFIAAHVDIFAVREKFKDFPVNIFHEVHYIGVSEADFEGIGAGEAGELRIAFQQSRTVSRQVEFRNDVDVVLFGKGGDIPQFIFGTLLAKPRL